VDWLSPQVWRRDSDVPCVSLGPPGAFDDAHIFAPCVAFEDGLFRMWYCGSRGTVEGRVFRMGFATSFDGVNFTKHPASPVLSFGDTRSILTPTLLRHPGGSLCREDGCLRMWFSSTDFPAGDGVHTLHETTGVDGLTWSPPSRPLLHNLYAPTIIKQDSVYRMWYTDVVADPWCFRYAESGDGTRWDVVPQPVMVLDQPWEHGRLFYPTVLVADGLHLMWYGSYSHRKGEETRTALGFAVSKDGITWEKSPSNPVFGPDPAHAWESNFTTSQSVLWLPDRSLRIWYASRPKPPFTHKYFAIGTARCIPGTAGRMRRPEAG